MYAPYGRKSKKRYKQVLGSMSINAQGKYVALTNSNQLFVLTWTQIVDNCNVLSPGRENPNESKESTNCKLPSEHLLGSGRGTRAPKVEESDFITLVIGPMYSGVDLFVYQWRRHSRTVQRRVVYGIIKSFECYKTHNNIYKDMSIYIKNGYLTSKMVDCLPPNIKKELGLENSTSPTFEPSLDSASLDVDQCSDTSNFEIYLLNSISKNQQSKENLNCLSKFVEI